MPNYRTEINVHGEELINILNTQFLYKEMQGKNPAHKMHRVFFWFFFFFRKFEKKATHVTPRTFQLSST